MNSIPSTPFVHRHLFRLLTRTYPPFLFLFLPYSSPNFLLRLFLPLPRVPPSLPPFPFDSDRDSKSGKIYPRFLSRNSNENKSNNQRKASTSSWKFVERKIKGPWWERWLTVGFPSFIKGKQQSWREVARDTLVPAENRRKEIESTGEKSLSLLIYKNFISFVRRSIFYL